MAARTSQSITYLARVIIRLDRGRITGYHLKNENFEGKVFFSAMNSLFSEYNITYVFLILFFDCFFYD